MFKGNLASKREFIFLFRTIDNHKNRFESCQIIKMPSKQNEPCVSVCYTKRKNDFSTICALCRYLS